METLVYIGTAFALGAAAGFAISRYLAPARHAGGESVARHEYETARQHIAKLEGQSGALQQQLTEEKDSLARLREELRLRGEKAAALETEKRLLDQKMAEMDKRFGQLAKDVLAQNTKEFNEQSKLSLSEMLKPIKQDFDNFRKTVDESFGAHFRNQSTLKDEIQKIVLQADNLTKALKGDSKAQGNWGEVMLERILEDAGLQKGVAYIVQGAGMGLRHVEDGSLLKPDYIIRLPDEKHLIIDSKVSLTHYEQYCAAEEEVKPVLLQQHIASIRKHVTGLVDRRYQDASGLGTPDFVLMFMPIEGAYSLAVQHDQQLHAWAWDKRVVIVCPSTLFATMRIVSSLWKIEAQNCNAEEIAKRGGALYDKIAGFFESMENIGKHLDRAQNVFEEAKKRLSGQGGVLRQAEMLKELGAKTSKSLPKELTGDEEDEKTAFLTAVN